MAQTSKSSIPFQVLSDLHLEVNNEYASFDIPVSSQNLILAGDVGCLADYYAYRAFLQKQTDRFQTVFLVLGNHEFYHQSFPETIAKARKLQQEPCFKGRLVLLHQKRYDIPDSDVTILGCTLWSSIPAESKDVVHSKIKDFKNIHNWTVDDHNAAHGSDLTWLQNELATIPVPAPNSHTAETNPRSILVITHHAPSLQKTSSPQHAQKPWGSAFGSDLLSESWDGVRWWVFGHTHYNTLFEEGGVRVLSNQRGYVRSGADGGGKENGFDVGRVIWV